MGRIVGVSVRLEDDTKSIIARKDFHNRIPFPSREAEPRQTQHAPSSPGLNVVERIQTHGKRELRVCVAEARPCLPMSFK